MTIQLPPTLERVARANPVRPDDELGQRAAAQATLARIMADDRPASDARPAADERLSPDGLSASDDVSDARGASDARAAARGRRWRAGWHGRRLAIVLAAALLLAVGAAVAATDPFGLFRSPNPGSAIFGIDPSRHVVPPTEFHIACPHPGSGTFACGSRLTGQRYMLLNHVESNGPPITRAAMQAALRKGRRQGRLSAPAVRRLTEDLAGVSDHFLSRLNVMFRFGTYSTNLTPEGTRRLAPPPGVPSLLICEPAGAVLRCGDMNGDGAAAIGSGIYQALPAPDWRPAPPQQPDPGWQLEVAILGHPPTAAEQRLLIDLLSYGTTSSSSSSAPTRAR